MILIEFVVPPKEIIRSQNNLDHSPLEPVMICPERRVRSLPPLQPSGKSPCLDHYGRGVFGGNGTRVGLVPKVGVGSSYYDGAGGATTEVLSCHIPGRPSAGLFLSAVFVQNGPSRFHESFRRRFRRGTNARQVNLAEFSVISLRRPPSAEQSAGDCGSPRRSVRSAPRRSGCHR